MKVKSFYNLIVLIIIVAMVGVANSTFRGNFTKEKINKYIKIGMTKSEFEVWFGLPDRTEVATFGYNTSSGPWRGLIYYYDKGILFNIFVFELEHKEPILNHWKILFSD